MSAERERARRVVLIGGGGIAGLMQGATVALRAKSGLFTGGLANAVVASVELVGATTTAVLALLVPLVALALVIALLVVSYRTLRRLTRWGRAAP